jgi:hypothetical protein
LYCIEIAQTIFKLQKGKKPITFRNVLKKLEGLIASDHLGNNNVWIWRISKFATALNVVIVVSSFIIFGVLTIELESRFFLLT